MFREECQTKKIEKEIPTLFHLRQNLTGARLGNQCFVGLFVTQRHRCEYSFRLSIERFDKERERESFQFSLRSKSQF